MNDRKLMEMALDALEAYPQGWRTDKAQNVMDALRDRLAQPKLTRREIDKMVQSAWKEVRIEYRDDPEICFDLGWEAGYGAGISSNNSPRSVSEGSAFGATAPPITQLETDAVLAEREACAKLCEEYTNGKYMAAVIRARSSK